MISVRLRRPDTSAVWAPTTGAYLCDRHATAGAHIDVIVEPTYDGSIEVSTWAVEDGQEGSMTTRVVPITQGASRRA
jgi:hypothetical protein